MWCSGLKLSEYWISPCVNLTSAWLIQVSRDVYLWDKMPDTHFFNLDDLEELQ